jgi:hypothetical protein
MMDGCAVIIQDGYFIILYLIHSESIQLERFLINTYIQVDASTKIRSSVHHVMIEKTVKDERQGHR